MRKILEGRGIASEEDIREFLSEKPKLAHDPFLLPDAEAGADFLIGALSRGDRICVYGDYDVDGICGTAMLVLFFREAARAFGVEPSVTYYIPSRIEEGYGLNNAALLAVREEGADVVVTVDCGSVSAVEAAYAKEIGLEMVITDHHDPDMGSLPDCLHINPKLKGAAGETYPFERLSGSGVAFKLCGAIVGRLEARGALGDALTTGGVSTLRSALRSFVDLACVATIADVMPLVDENRTLVKYGLSMLGRGSRPAFRELLMAADIDPARLNVRDVAFGIAPRLNALGRLGDASEGVEFFLTEDAEKMRELAVRMDMMNTERRRIQDECLDACMAIYETGLDGAGESRHRFLLLRPESAHEGVAGIVAGKVREETGWPCAVLTESGDRSEEGGFFLKGSARSSGRLDLIGLLRQHAGMFERLGGHAAAAGFLIKADNEGPLREALSGELDSLLAKDPDLLDCKENPELEIKSCDIGLPLAEAIEELAPFGAGNQKPLLSLAVPSAEISNVRSIGRGGKHVRFTAGGISCVFFGGGKTVFPEDGMVRIVGCPEANEWGGRRSVQLAVTYVDML
ncbi:MAG: single-stranded-DNA-specific exonuclease RecJ [Clostridiales bacterium]|nr:single-stranded-DNA-specific exonuclease RecJ [Clostridiales bacterium]